MTIDVCKTMHNYYKLLFIGVINDSPSLHPSIPSSLSPFLSPSIPSFSLSLSFPLSFFSWNSILQFMQKPDKCLNVIEKAVTEFIQQLVLVNNFRSS